MPYLRLYLPEISIAQKRHISHKLIQLTLNTFRRRRHWDRDQITIQFLPQSRERQRADCRIEIHCHDDLPFARKQAFAEEVTPLLIRSLHLHVKDRLAWLMGIGARRMPKVDVQFRQLPFDDAMPGEWAVGDALLTELDHVA